VIPVDFVFGLAAGLAVAVGVYLLLLWRTRRSGVLDPPPVGAGWAGGIIQGSRAPEPPSLRGSNTGAPIAGAHADMDPAGPEAPSAPPIGDHSVDKTTHEHASRRSLSPSSVPKETLRLSQRLILHVYAQGELPPGAVAPPGLCQAGMVEALGIPQAGLAAVLKRLEAAGILATERGHVRGYDRRLKIYRLSSRGLEVAKELRSRPRVRPRG
jgi:DNA-binding MarR family transcriptional regulator